MAGKNIICMRLRFPITLAHLRGEEVAVDVLSSAAAAPVQQGGHYGAVGVQPRGQVRHRDPHLARGTLLQWY